MEVIEVELMEVTARIVRMMSRSRIRMDMVTAVYVVMMKVE